MSNAIFKNRTDAGRQLAEKLLRHKPDHPLILAIPRGGVPVGYEVARALEAPLDTLVARKIGAPMSPEFGVGAIAPADVIIIDTSSLEALGLKREDVVPVIEREKREMERRIARYRSGDYSKGSETATVIIVDDGLATGLTARAAIESVLKQHKTHTVILATPICAKDTAEALRNLVDVVCVQSVDNLVAIGYWYEEFPQTTDEEVVELLEKSNNYKQHD